MVHFETGTTRFTIVDPRAQGRIFRSIGGFPRWRWDLGPGIGFCSAVQDRCKGWKSYCISYRMSQLYIWHFQPGRCGGCIRFAIDNALRESALPKQLIKVPGSNNLTSHAATSHAAAPFPR
jgi:hypothetical protein